MLTLLIFFYIYFFCNFFPIQIFLPIPPLFHDLPPPFCHPYRFLRFFCIPPLIPILGELYPPFKKVVQDVWWQTIFSFVTYKGGRSFHFHIHCFWSFSFTDGLQNIIIIIIKIIIIIILSFSVSNLKIKIWIIKRKKLMILFWYVNSK